MKIIGITGGVGAGKSEVLAYLAEAYHAEIVEADKVGHLLMEPDGACYGEIVKKFGSGILKSDKMIDRGRLGKIVFADEEKRMALNAIVHPRVKEYIITQIEKERAEKKASLFVIEAALLLEDHYDVICDEIWYIDTNEAARAERLKQSRGYSDEKIAAMMAAQKSPEQFRKACQAVIDNSGSLESTKEQIDRRLKE